MISLFFQSKTECFANGINQMRCQNTLCIKDSPINRQRAEDTKWDLIRTKTMVWALWGDNRDIKFQEWSNRDTKYRNTNTRPKYSHRSTRCDKKEEWDREKDNLLLGWNERPLVAVFCGASTPRRRKRASVDEGFQLFLEVRGGSKMSRRRGFSSSEEEEDERLPPTGGLPRQHKGAQFATRWKISHHQHHHCLPSSRAGQLSPLQDDTYSDPTQYVAGLNIMIGTMA